MSSQPFLKLIVAFAIIFQFSMDGFAQKKIQKFENGNIQSEEEFKDGHYVGNAMYYYESGKKKTEARYDSAGVLIGYEQWNENGDMIDYRDLKSEQLAKGITDLSQIKWTIKDRIGYNFMDEGEGNLPKEGDVIVLNYIGYFESGYQFENTFNGDYPLQFEVGKSNLISSFANSISNFKKGQKGYIKIPPDLAYGDKPTGNIPANSTLIYYVEIVDVKR